MMFDWARYLRKLGIFLFPDGRPDAPHILLPSDLSTEYHTDNYFYPAQLFSNPQVLREAVTALVDRIYPRADFKNPTLVVTPSVKTQCLGYEMGYQLNCPVTYLEGRNEHLLLKGPAFNLEGVLVVDLIFNPHEIEVVIKTIEAMKGNVLPFIPVIYSFHSNSIMGNREIVSLIKRVSSRWSKGDCPFCQQGSKALRPEEAWQKFFPARQ